VLEVFDQLIRYSKCRQDDEETKNDSFRVVLDHSNISKGKKGRGYL
jgi:hypothetical protein